MPRRPKPSRLSPIWRAKHPDSPLAAEANFHVGESQYEKAAYGDAAKAYTAAKQKSQPGELREKATYKLGWSLFQEKKYQEALAQFAEQATDQPQGPLAADALFMKAECLFRLEKYPDALPVYLATQNVKLASPTSQILALLHGGQSALQAEKWDQAIALLSQIPEKHQDSPYLPEAYCELGRAKQNSGKEADAMQDYEKAATLSRGEVGARARFMTGELAFSQKNFAEAVRQFQRVMFGYGGESADARSQEMASQSGVRGGPLRRSANQGRAGTGSRRTAETSPTMPTSTSRTNILKMNWPRQAKKRLEELSKLYKLDGGSKAGFHDRRDVLSQRRKSTPCFVNLTPGLGP